MTTLNHEDSGIVDLGALRAGGTTPTALPLGRAPARERRRRLPRPAAALATLAMTLVASSVVLAATLSKSEGVDPIVPVRMAAIPASTGAGPGRAMVMDHAPSVATAVAPDPDGDRARSEVPGDRSVRISATSPTRRASAAPSTARRQESESGSGGELAFAPESQQGAPLDDDIDALLERALRGGGAVEATRPTLPELPTRGQVASAMRSVSGAVQACAPDADGVATARAVVDGPSGAVTGVTVGGAGLDGPVRACIAQQIEGVRFPRFERTAFQVSFPYVL